MSAQLPDHEHWLKGSRPTRAKKEPGFAVEPGRPKMPKDLTEEQQGTFKRMRHILEKRRACTHGDVEILRMFSVIHSRWQKALRMVEEQGEVCEYSRLDANGKEVTTEKVNIWLGVAERAEKNLVALLDRLGLTPNARAKVKPTAEKEKAEEYPVGTVGWFQQNRAQLKAEQQPAPGVADLPPVKPAPVDDAATDFDA